MIELVLNNIVEISCITVVTGFFAAAGYILEKAKGLLAAVMAISHDQLYRQGEFYILTGEITVNELKNLEYLYGGYHALGGNGTGTELYEKCQELPVVDRRTKWNPYYTQRMKGES
mgnify:CR=1 FL=1